MVDAELVIIRGLPGSGKTTLAREIAKRAGYLHLENDMYLESENGYQYTANLAREASEWCFTAVRDALLSGQRVVVSNGFTRIDHMWEYFKLTQDFVVIECKGQYKSIHNVPDEVIESKRAIWQPCPNAVVIGER